MNTKLDQEYWAEVLHIEELIAPMCTMPANTPVEINKATLYALQVIAHELDCIRSLHEASLLTNGHRIE